MPIPHPHRGKGWSYGLTVEQEERCRQVMRLHGDPERSNKYNRHTPNASPYNGWSIYRLPSLGNPPKVVRIRYRDFFGRLTIDEDCS